MLSPIARSLVAVLALGLLYGCTNFWAGFDFQSLLAGEPSTGQAEADTNTSTSDRDSNKNQASQKHPFPNRRPAPSLESNEQWLNTAGPIDLRDLRGKFVLLDFWTYCCINCIHILPELKKLEQAYPNEIVVIGVHSGKFEAEKGVDNIRQAILRYNIEHPVINDKNHVIWNRYGIRSWPSLRAIDPQGNLIGSHSGEISFAALNGFFSKAISYYKKRGLLDATPLRFDLERHHSEHQPLHFPGKVLADANSNRLYISDSGHHRIVVTDLDGQWIENIGTGVPGSENGDFDRATFNSPQGLALVANKLYVADTQNHLIRVVDLKQRNVSTLAGTGEQNRRSWPGMERIEVGVGGILKKLPKNWSSPPKQFPLASPWALLVHENYLYIAMAGSHQIWRIPLEENSGMEVFAGNGREDIIDGIRVPEAPPIIDERGFGPKYACFAQPSGLASDGTTLYVADSEGSAIRAVPFSDNNVDTIVGASNLPQGRALFSFGDKDDKGEAARLQHVLGIAEHDGNLYITDTYNNKIKKIGIESRETTTIAGSGKPGKQDSPAQFDEPAGISYARGNLYVADTNNHAIRVINLKNNQVKTLAIRGLKNSQHVDPPEPHFPNAQRVTLDPIALRPDAGKITLLVHLSLPQGWKLNNLNPIRYQISEEYRVGSMAKHIMGDMITLSSVQNPNELKIDVPLSLDSGNNKITLSLTCYYCRKGAEGLCKVESVIWSIPVRLSDSAKDSQTVLRHMLR